MIIFAIFSITLANAANLQPIQNEVLFWPPKAPDTSELIRGNNYPVEVHNVTTEDGYILTVFRIPHGSKDNGYKDNKKPVIIQHGVLCDSDCWAIVSPEKGLPYLLADRGYDVWITNSRGTTYGLRHTNLTIKDEKFWDYSVHELGYYDLPGFIDYILNETKYEKLAYIGHSQGTTEFFIMSSTRPEYNGKVQIMAALGPVAYLDDTKGAVQLISRFSKFLASAAKILHIHHVLGQSKILQFISLYCSKSKIIGYLCDDVFFSIAGFDSPQVNQTLISLVGGYCPTGASVKQLIHFGQLTSNGGKFSYFDYGREGNLKRYNMASPPEYDISKIIVPVALYHGYNDLISTPPEVVQLSEELPNLVTRTMIDYRLFNHLDFMWAIDVNALLNYQVIKLIDRYMWLVKKQK